MVDGGKEGAVTIAALRARRNPELGKALALRFDDPSYK